MDSEPALESLMVRYQQGDLSAATALVDRLSPQLHRFFFVQVASREHSDDLLQETWLRLHEARHTYRAGEPVLPWLYAIARHVRVDHYRKVLRAEINEQVLAWSAEVAQNAAAAPVRTPDVESLLAALPESQREVVAMLKVAGMSLEEVALATASTVGSVKQKASRAYENLRRRVSEMGIRGFSKGRRS
jgi:RNA polymerase sigma-70 factor, ECF subfamily